MKKNNQEKITEIVRELDDGEGITVSLGVGDNVDYFYTNRIKPPKGMADDFVVEISSSQSDNAELLHYLLTKSRNSTS